MGPSLLLAYTAGLQVSSQQLPKTKLGAMFNCIAGKTQRLIGAYHTAKEAARARDMVAIAVRTVFDPWGLRTSKSHRSQTCQHPARILRVVLFCGARAHCSGFRPSAWDNPSMMDLLHCWTDPSDRTFHWCPVVLVYFHWCTGVLVYFHRCTGQTLIVCAPCSMRAAQLRSTSTHRPTTCLRCGLCSPAQGAGVNTVSWCEQLV